MHCCNVAIRSNRKEITFFISSHIGIADSLPTTAYVKMIDVFMIFTMTVPLLEIIGHTYAVYLKKKVEELDSLYDPPKHPLESRSGSVGISIQPLGLDNAKLVKSKIFAHDKRWFRHTSVQRILFFLVP